MKYRTIFFDIDYCLMDTPTSERRIIRELYAHQGLVGYTVSERVDAVLLDKRAIAGLKVK